MLPRSSRHFHLPARSSSMLEPAPPRLMLLPSGAPALHSQDTSLWVQACQHGHILMSSISSQCLILQSVGTAMIVQRLLLHEGALCLRGNSSSASSLILIFMTVHAAKTSSRDTCMQHCL